VYALFEVRNDGLSGARAGEALGRQHEDAALLRRDRPAAAAPHRRRRLPRLRSARGRPAAGDPVLPGAGRAAGGDRAHPGRSRLRPRGLAPRASFLSSGRKTAAGGADRQRGKDALQHERREHHAGQRKI